MAAAAPPAAGVAPKLPITTSVDGKTQYIIRGCAECGCLGGDDGVPLKKCSKCKRVYYCDRECQVANWSEHKPLCHPTTTTTGIAPTSAPASGSPAEKKQKQKPKPKPKQEEVKYLTWRELEEYAGETATNRTLEVTIVADESFTRQVVQGKDRRGDIMRIAVYTDSRRLPGLMVGKVFRWTNPRFHYFMDGSAGCRIEDEDLRNINII